MADQFAANGYYTLIVDLFNGDPIKLNRDSDFDFMAWLNKGTDGNNPHTFEYVDPIVEKGLAYLKEQGFKKIGSTGYCFVSLSESSKVYSAAHILDRVPNMFADTWQKERGLMSDTLHILRKDLPISTQAHCY